MSASAPEVPGADLAAETVRAFLAMLASRAPAPGGGAAAALAGALGSALIGMVCRVTGERDAALAAEMTATAERADALRARLEALMTEDAAAYRGVIAARRTGGGPEAVDRALIAATEAPMATARAAADVLALCVAAAPRARARALGDLGVAAATAQGALESAAITARANLADLTDEALARQSLAELSTLIEAGREAHSEASLALDHRQGAGPTTRERGQARQHGGPRDDGAPRPER